MSPALAVLGISILGTWGLASIGLIAAGIILLFFPNEAPAVADKNLAGVIALISGLAVGGMMQMMTMPLLGIDLPFPLKAKKIIPFSKMKTWTKAGPLADFPDGMPKEVTMRTMRVLIVRSGADAYALNGLCSHARLPIGGIPGSPIKAQPVRDGCIECPFHGARFEASSGKVVRQPFSSQFNNDHPFLGRIQSKLLFFNKKAEDSQTYPVKIENGIVMVHLPR